MTKFHERADKEAETGNLDYGDPSLIATYRLYATSIVKSLSRQWARQVAPDQSADRSAQSISDHPFV